MVKEAETAVNESFIHFFEFLKKLYIYFLVRINKIAWRDIYKCDAFCLLYIHGKNIQRFQEYGFKSSQV